MRAVFTLFLSACVLHRAGSAALTSASTTSTATPGTPTSPPSPQGFAAGGPGCGLDAAAFCDTFDAPAAQQNRTGELDDTRWSGGRMAPHFPSAEGHAIDVGVATIPSCRADIPSQVQPDRDALICDPTASIPSPHLLIAAAEQYYGQASFRIRQPFDFAGRTGKIVFDADAYITNFLYGWISLDVTEDPIDAPSFMINNASNDEGAMIPKNGFEVQMRSTCPGYTDIPSFALSEIEVYNNYVDTPMSPATPVCMPEQQGQLSHFEIDVSQSKIDVYASLPSADGVTFAPLQLLYSANVSLPFSRGYVQITVHNHATLKYSLNAIDAWSARWDNVGFDGPVVTNTREYSVPDSLVTHDDGFIDIGYRVADVAQAPTDVLHFSDVDLAGAVSAQLALSVWYLADGGQALSAYDYSLRYRMNGHDWHDRPLNDAEIAMLQAAVSQGALAQTMDVPVAELVSGDNTIEFLTVNAPQNYPPVVANIDLVLGL